MADLTTNAEIKKQTAIDMDDLSFHLQVLGEGFIGLTKQMNKHRGEQDIIALAQQAYYILDKDFIDQMNLLRNTLIELLKVED
ncbi:hypothetical protein UFOVP180_44 [uncultured Caudovirales phage]|uniref:Uncharacterized protein n=1 Tax=uncultured Caudovirales phage TaxID=2100421 RepID=A0A6J7WI08_9CAUD|nr:hypothetical protein UFOVP180_44 [uncultured Caudovirales phage]